MLVGIVKKNAIMMIDFAIEAQRKGGKPAAEAIYQACQVRFRPIMMTTFAALMGACRLRFPSEPAETRAVRSAWRSSGDSVLSQFLTLYITPVIYLLLRGRLPAVARRAARHPATWRGWVQRLVPVPTFPSWLQAKRRIDSTDVSVRSNSTS